MLNWKSNFFNIFFFFNYIYFHILYVVTAKEISQTMQWNTHNRPLAMVYRFYVPSRWLTSVRLRRDSFLTKMGIYLGVVKTSWFVVWITLRQRNTTLRSRCVTSYQSRFTTYIWLIIVGWRRIYDTKKLMLKFLGVVKTSSIYFEMSPMDHVTITWRGLN